MEGLPLRGPGVRELGLVLPPDRMPLLRRGRPLKRWRWVGVFSPELMLCAGDARVGPLPSRWWAVAEPGRPLRERTALVGAGGLELGERSVSVRAPGVRIELELEPDGETVEVASPSGATYVWTEKLPCVARGSVEVDGRRHELDGRGLVDTSAGYHPRATAWHWSAGVGQTEAGARVTWNLVTGIHDSPEASERTVWIDGEPHEVGPVEFDRGLGGLRPAGDGRPGLRFEEWSARSSRIRLGLIRHVYRQPFGSFSGELPDGSRLAAGHGVMEEHDARW